MANSPYRTKSFFDFEDEYGSDPIIARYGVTPARARSYELDAKLAASDYLDAETNRLDAEAELAMAQAEEEAKLAPLRAVTERFKAITELSSQRSKLEEDARKRTAEANFNEYFPKVTNVQELDKLVAGNADVVLDPANQERIRYMRSKFAEQNKAELRTKFPAVMSPEDVDKLELWAGERQLLGDPEVKSMLEIWRGVAAKKASAMKGLTQLGAQAMPVTRKGEFDVARAENIVEALGRTDIRTLSAAQRGLQKQLEDPMLDPESPEAKAIQEDLNNINRQIAGIMDRNDAQTTRAAGDLESLGGAAPNWADDIINGSSSGAPAANSPNPTAAPAAASAPQAPEPTPEPRQPDPRVEQADQTVQKAREEAGLAQQPWGIRQVNEAFSVDNADVREKAAKARTTREKIDPYADENLRDPQTIQEALSIVYPEIGEDSNRFDIGNSNDPRVAMAAEYLLRIDPALLKMIASSPGRGGRRGSLTFEELPELAKRAAVLRSKVRTGSPRGSRE